MALQISLSRRWQVLEPFASGGFGEIFAALSDDDSPAVVKLVPKDSGAKRELLFEPISGLPNVIPILDSGEVNDHYALVMPRADQSLRQFLCESGGKVAPDHATPILIDIAKALVGLEGTVVHRDLKPENVLHYRGAWCLSDFGIARYAAATTALDTRRSVWSPPYAAPEQWREERATSATDLYAFGVIAFELIQGERPFPGPQACDYREQHLREPVPEIGDCPQALSSLITECLQKSPGARPDPGSILKRLQASQRPATPTSSRLQEVYGGVIRARADEDARQAADRTAEMARAELFDSARQSFDRIGRSLTNQISIDAPGAVQDSPRSQLAIRLGDARLVIETPVPVAAGSLQVWDYNPPFDVVTAAAITVRKPLDRYGYEGRSHSLWFCDAHVEGTYRWYELSFGILQNVPQTLSLEPFALGPSDPDAAEAFTPVVTVSQIAWKPLPFDRDDSAQFKDRWLGWFADAVDGTLHRPNPMPEDSRGRSRLPQRRQA